MGQLVVRQARLPEADSAGSVHGFDLKLGLACFRHGLNFEIFAHPLTANLPSFNSPDLLAARVCKQRNAESLDRSHAIKNWIYLGWAEKLWANLGQILGKSAQGFWDATIMAVSKRSVFSAEVVDSE